MSSTLCAPHLYYNNISRDAARQLRETFRRRLALTSLGKRKRAQDNKELIHRALNAIPFWFLCWLLHLTAILPAMATYSSNRSALRLCPNNEKEIELKKNETGVGWLNRRAGHKKKRPDDESATHDPVIEFDGDDLRRVMGKRDTAFRTVALYVPPRRKDTAGS